MTDGKSFQDSNVSFVHCLTKPEFSLVSICPLILLGQDNLCELNSFFSPFTDNHLAEYRFD